MQEICKLKYHPSWMCNGHVYCSVLEIFPNNQISCVQNVHACVYGMTYHVGHIKRHDLFTALSNV